MRTWVAPVLGDVPSDVLVFLKLQATVKSVPELIYGVYIINSLGFAGSEPLVCVVMNLKEDRKSQHSDQ